MRTASIGIAVSLLVAASTLGASANDDFKIDYRIERTEATKLSLAQCTRILRQTAQEMRIPTSVSDQNEPAVALFGGLGDGQGSIVAYCITAGDKTVHLVQGIGYRPGSTVAAYADRAHRALLDASK